MVIPPKVIQAANDNISVAQSRCKQRELRYIRNLSRYMNMQVSQNDLDSLYDVNALGNWIPLSANIDWYTTFNGIASCVDTLSSKISQAETLPRITPVDGSFFTRKTCLNVQKNIEVYFDNKKVYNKCALSFRDSTLFDFGVLHVDGDMMDVERVPTYEYYCDPYEFALNKLSFVYRNQARVPRHVLKAQFKNIENDIGMLSNVNRFVTYYDLVNKWKLYFVNGALYEKACHPIDSNVSPFVIMHYKESVKGFFTQTLTDDLYPLQCRVDEMELYIKSAARKSAKHVLVAARGANFKWSKNSNDILDVWEFDAPPDGAPALQFATPDPISPMYTQLRDSYLLQMYNLSGISQASAMAHIQSNIKSGTMLQTSQDIESERFNIPLKNYQHAHIDIAKTMMAVFPKDKPVIDGESTVWGDVVEEQKKFKVQFTGSALLSKDPQTRREELAWYLSTGMIDKQQAGEMLQLPDTYRLDDIVNAAGNYCEKIIERVLTSEDPKPHLQGWSPVVKLDLLLSKVSRYRMEMDTNDAEKDTLDRLDMLYKVTAERLMAANVAKNPPPPPLPPERPDVNANYKDLPPEAQAKFLTQMGLVSTPAQPEQIATEQNAMEASNA